MNVDIYSDVVCPWCYLGTRRFAEALAAFDGRDSVQVTFRPFQLDENASTTPIRGNDHLIAKYGPEFQTRQVQLREMALAEGLDMRFDLTLHVNSLTAHRLAWLARSEYGVEVQWNVEQGLFAAYFSRGENVSDHTVLTDVGVAAGMDRTRTAAYLASDQGIQEVRDAVRGARGIGVTSVPTFVFEEQWAVIGAQPTEVFRQALDQVAEKVAQG